jgi:hypothetical protein
MILAASGIAGPIVTLLLRASAFSAAAQLTLRQGILASGAGPTREKMHKGDCAYSNPIDGERSRNVDLRGTLRRREHVAVYPDRVDGIEE